VKANDVGRWVVRKDESGESESDGVGRESESDKVRASDGDGEETVTDMEEEVYVQVEEHGEREWNSDNEGSPEGISIRRRRERWCS
jgi:hypothetical protein